MITVTTPVTEPDPVRAAIGVTGRSPAVDGLLTGRENLILMADPHRLGRPRAGAGRTICWSGSTRPRRVASRPRPAPAACGGG